jgi:hypothetical protein
LRKWECTLKRLGFKCGAVLGGWTVLAVLLAADQYAGLLARGTPTRFFHLLRWTVSDYWIWAALTPLVFRVASKVRFSRRNVVVSLPVHCLGCLAFSLLHVTIAMLIGIPRGPSAAGVSVAALQARLFMELLISA